VVRQQAGERNFHSFYQLLSGIDSRRLSEWGLSRQADEYYYLWQGGKLKCESSRDISFKDVLNALKSIGSFDSERTDEACNC